MSADYRNESHCECKEVFFAGTDALKMGYALCYDADTLTDPRGNVLAAAATGWGRYVKVEKPAAANLGAFAGFCIRPITGPGWTTVVRPRAGQSFEAHVQARA